jgi:signal transduction histidine kinase
MSQSESLYQSTIVRNGLLFVLLPLIGATLILFFLHLLWLSAERISAEERRQSEVVGLLHGIFSNWSVIDNSYMGLVSEHSPKFRVDIKNNDAMMRQALFEMNQKRQNDPEKLAVLQKISDLIERECTLMSSLPETTSAPDTPSLILMQQMPLTLLGSYKMRGEVRQLLESEWLALRSARESAQKNQGMVRALLYGVTVFNIAGGILLAATFAVRMATRISQLGVNAELLHRNQRLRERLKGNDELAYLDSVLHDVERRLSEAAQHRQWILSMVAHDMRSPLMSARANLQIMEELDDDYPEQGVDELQSVYKLLEKVLRQVQRLLGAQKELSSIAVSQLGTGVAASSLPGADWKTTLLRPGILRQSIVMMLCPLLFQVFLFFVIDQQLLATERTMIVQRRCGDIALYSDMALMDMVRGSLVQAAYVMSRVPVLNDKAWAAFDQVNRDYSDLDTVCGDNPDWRKFVALSKVAAKHKIDRMLTSSALNMHDAALLFLDVGEVKQRSADAVQLRALERRLFAENLDRWTDEDLLRANLAKSVGFAIALSFAVNLMFAIFLILFFTRLTRDRLNALMRNAVKLGQHKQLEPCITGSDEIANLDFSIHEADARLEASSKERVLLMSALASDIQEPLEQAARHIRKFENLGGDALSAKSRDYIKLSEESIVRVFTLVSELLTMEELEAGKIALAFTACDMHSLADKSIGVVSGIAAQKQIVIENRCSRKIFKADDARIVQVLMNYLGNALKFSPAGAKVSVSTIERGDYIRVFVSDEGPGIDKGMSERIFERYFQAEGAQRQMGYGLGLAICKLIVESHRGALGVESQPGHGSTFWFEIPLSL